MNKIRFALPKGSLAEASFEILERAGYLISGHERTYRPGINDPEIELKILRPQEIPISVGEGLQDIGITGLDWVRETHAQVEVLLNLEYGKVKIVVAVPKTWTTINSLSELLEVFKNKGRALRISTEYLNVSAEYVKANPFYPKFFKDSEPLIVTPWWRKGSNSNIRIFLSFGATEAKPPEDADAIIDVIETGRTLEQNNLKIIEEIMESTAVLVTNKNVLIDPWKREKIYDILNLLKGAVDGRKKLHIFVNVKEEDLNKLLSALPALKKPTISPLSEDGWFSVNTVIEKDYFLGLLPNLRRLAQGLVVYEPRQVLTLNEVEEEEKGE
jgi:ATP phosphoribosyltransferase